MLWTFDLEIFNQKKKFKLQGHTFTILSYLIWPYIRTVLFDLYIDPLLDNIFFLKIYTAMSCSATFYD
jgi:hypothetical protein